MNQEKRKHDEISVIMVLAILSLIIYGLFFGLKFLYGDGNENTKDYVLDRGIENVKKIRLENQGTRITMEKKSGDWIVSENPGISLEQTQIFYIEKVLAELTFERYLPDIVFNDDDANKFGFGNSTSSFSIIDSDNNEDYFIIGNYNNALNEYYILDEVSKSVYLCAAEKIEQIYINITDISDNN